MSIAARNPTDIKMIDAALEYARRGWHVIPIWWPLPNNRCACGRPDCLKRGNQGKHPIIPEWQNKASKDPAQITKWFKDWPKMNIGIVAGEKSNLLILDVDLSKADKKRLAGMAGPVSIAEAEADAKNDGPATLLELEKENGRLPDTVEAKTGSGGRHIFFKHQKKFAIKNSSKFKPGLDTKTNDGFVVAAPSLHVSGNRYEWDIGFHPDDTQLAECPEWLLRLMYEPNKKASKATLDVESIYDGARNDTLFKIAATWRNQPGMSEDVILAGLIKLNENKCKPPLELIEVELIAKSAAGYPTTAKIPAALNTATPIVGNEQSVSGFPQTDYGNAERLIHKYGQDLRWDTRRSKWIHWNNKHWEFDESGAITRMAKDVARQLYDEVSSINDSSERREAVKYARSCESRAKILAMIELSKSLENVTVLPDKLDTDPWLLNVQNGTIDLKTCQLKPHNREDLITRVLSIEYNPNEKCPRWLNFLNHVFAGDIDLIRFIQKAIGYSLTGNISEQCIFIPYGGGANGKSVFLSTISSLMGEYAAQSPISTLTVKKGESISNDLARLKGKRFVSASESEVGQMLAESLIKQLSGEDKLSVRFLHQEFFEFIPEFKVWLATNHLPRVRGTDHGIWRRIRLIPFNVTIKDDEKDPELTRKLRNELSGILTWAIEGLKLWQKEGLLAPKVISKATAQYREQSDVIGSFIEEECSISENLRVMARDIFKCYQNWCEENEEHTLSKRQFSQKMIERGFVNEKGSGGYYFFKGIGLTHKPMLGV